MFGFVSPPNVVPPKPRSASSEALRPSSHSPPRGRPFSCPRSATDGAAWRPPSSKSPAWPAAAAAGRCSAACPSRLARRRAAGPDRPQRQRQDHAVARAGAAGAGRCRHASAGRAPTSPDDREAWRRPIAWLGHLDGLKGDLTVRENLVDRLRGCASAPRRRRRRTPSPPSISPRSRDRPVRTLSAGQRRRVALARVVLRQAPALAARRAAERPRCAVAGGVARRARPAPRRRRPRDRRHPCADLDVRRRARRWSSRQ